MDQSELEASFEVNQNANVVVVPKETADRIEEINSELETNDYSEEEIAEKKSEKDRLVTEASTEYGLGMGHRLSLEEDELEPGETYTLDEIEGEMEFTGVYGITDLEYNSEEDIDSGLEDPVDIEID
jgi:hypothetical protein